MNGRSPKDKLQKEVRRILLNILHRGHDGTKKALLGNKHTIVHMDEFSVTASKAIADAIERGCER